MGEEVKGGDTMCGILTSLVTTNGQVAFAPQYTPPNWKDFCIYIYLLSIMYTHSNHYTTHRVTKPYIYLFIYCVNSESETLYSSGGHYVPCLCGGQAAARFQ